MTRETILTVVVVAAIVAVPVFIVAQDRHVVAVHETDGAKVLTLTGVAEDGIWTLQQVNCGNYWWKTFDRAIIHVEVGDLVVLRLQGADVHHRFYAPGLGIEPVDVEPGHTEIVSFRAKSPGIFQYYCTALCGQCHFYMSGWIVVSAKGQTPSETISEELLAGVQCSLHELPEPSGDDMIERGRYLYQKNSCTTCHGKDGQGQVPNLNATKRTVPAHNTLAEKFFLEDEESTQAFIDLLTKRRNLDEIENHDDIPRFMLVRTQYKAARDLIIKGQTTAKLDKAALEPPLQMASFRELLTDRDIDSIFAYLLTLYPWEQDEEYEEPAAAESINSVKSPPSSSP